VPEKPFLVALDAGHGGAASSDPEQLFDAGSSAFGLAEKDVTLDLAQRMEAQLREERVDVFMTRTRDEFLTAAERVRRAQAAHADALISLHLSADSSDPTASGMLIIYPRVGSAAFAETMHAQLVAGIQKWQLDDGGALLKSDQWAKLDIPTVTVLPAFISNPHEAELLKNAEFKDAIAAAVVKGLLAAFPNLEHARPTPVQVPRTAAATAIATAAPAGRALVLGQQRLRGLWPVVVLVIALLLGFWLWQWWRHRGMAAAAGARPAPRPARDHASRPLGRRR
jgi:N-acetylmuramoyl-L-alanine amidase